MSIITWIFLGLISGFIASKVVTGSGRGIFRDMVLGVLGAFVGGVMFQIIGRTGVTGFNLWSVFVSAIGAIAVLVVYHAISGHRGRA
jgi:uncharacterized membrane protein YeaQ/YmgE (transglycosylase-associated protein family)